MSLPQAAAILNCSRSSVYIYATRGHEGRILETVKVGSRMKTTLAAINRFLGVADTPIVASEDRYGLKS